MNTIKIIIADDHKILVDGLIAILQPLPHIEVVGRAANGKEVLNLLNKQIVDVVLLDLSMPVMDGLETTLQIKQKYPRVKVLILTTNDEGSIIASVFESGANGYLLKNISNQQLIQGIEDAAAGKKVISNELTDKLIEGLQQKNEEIPHLTRREQQVLHLIAEELTLNDIAEKLNISVHTVVTHKRSLFVKMQTNTSVGLVRKAIQLGFLKA